MLILVSQTEKFYNNTTVTITRATVVIYVIPYFAFSNLFLLKMWDISAFSSSTPPLQFFVVAVRLRLLNNLI